MASTTLKITSLAALFASTFVFACSAWAGEAPLSVEGGPEVQRGAHLARLADCMGCHTYKEDKPYAGNKPMHSPFGVFYTSNLTQDKETGLGNWTYEDFKNALWHGKTKSGNYIYPAMPYTAYTKMREEDVRALWAYFKAIKPIHNPVRNPDLIVIGDLLPSLSRLGNLAWQIPFLDEGRFEPYPDRSEEFNRGAYYVQALGHCSSCHTPRNLAFAQKDDTQFLDGFVLNGWYAPRISPGPHSNIKDWDVDTLARFLIDGDLGTQTVAVGPMEEVWHDSLRHLPDADLHAIATYLKEMPANPNGKPKPAFVKIPADQAKLGHDVYDQHCATCHGASGEGTYGVAPALDRNSLVVAEGANSVVMAVLKGFDPKNVWGVMPAFLTQLNDKEVTAVSNYIRQAWHNNARADATEDMVASSRPAVARELPDNGQQPAAHCPSLPADDIRPALTFSEDDLLASYNNTGQISQFVSQYRSERGSASNGDTIKAMTAVYCRALAAKKSKAMSMAERDNYVCQYSQKVSEALGG